MTLSFKDYILHMQKDESYVDSILVEALSKVIKVGIKVVQLTG